MSVAEKCPRCDGCGLIASSEDGEPWTMWLDLPLGSSAAVLMGLVRPLPCPACAPRPGDLVETECVVCVAGREHPEEEQRLGKFKPHTGDRWVVQSVTPGRERISVYATACTIMGTPTILEYTGRNMKIVKRREELVAETFLGDR
jgi:hypothetical protein